jgi:prepilin-type N-terminal cleavage/methylation domain-containing protein
MTSALHKTRRGRERGYTAVEVLMAMTLFAIGAAGVIGMQRVVIQGGEDARRADMATNIANEWIARLQRDAGFWTQPNSAVPDTIDLNQTRWIKDVDKPCANFCNITMPGTPANGLSPAFDSFGRDLPTGTTQAVYCVQYRLQWIVPPGTPPYPKLELTGLMRAEVRVYYARLEATAIGDCSAPPPDAIPPVSPFHMVYAATAIRETQLR